MSEAKRLLGDLESRIREAINNAADGLNDATRWDQSDEADGDGKTPMDKLVMRISSEIQNEIAASKSEALPWETVATGQSQAIRSLKAEVERLLEEVEGVLSVMPPWSVIRSCEGGGHEDVAGSLALSVSCLVEHLRRRGA